MTEVVEKPVACMNPPVEPFLILPDYPGDDHFTANGDGTYTITQEAQNFIARFNQALVTYILAQWEACNEM